jgi:hypothetical protein
MTPRKEVTLSVPPGTEIVIRLAAVQFQPEAIRMREASDPLARRLFQAYASAASKVLQHNWDAGIDEQSAPMELSQAFHLYKKAVADAITVKHWSVATVQQLVGQIQQQVLHSEPVSDLGGPFQLRLTQVMNWQFQQAFTEYVYRRRK